MGLMNKVNQIDENFSYLSDDNKVSLLLYGDSRFDDNKNSFILSASITYILETERFSTERFSTCLVILFTTVFTFPFLATKYQLGHC